MVLGPQRPGFLSLSDLIAKPAALPKSRLSEIRIDPTDPAIFQLSGGTTGLPKLIPRTHNDYAYNSKMASKVCAIGKHSVVLIILPIAHNLPLACPGIQGVLFHGGRVVLSTSARPEDVCALIEKHRVTHIKVVPALLIRFAARPRCDSSQPFLAQNYSKRRPVHAARSAFARQKAHSQRIRAGKFPECPKVS